MNRRAFSLVLVLMAALGAVRTQANADDPTSDTRSLSVSGVARTYHVYHPTSAHDGAPLVVVLHGGGGTGPGAEASYHWNAAADSGGFVVVFPDGLNRAWNAGSCCGSSAQSGVDDVALLSAVVKAVEESDHTDVHRVFFTGMSNGAFMAYRMACEAPIAIAGIASVAGTITSPCSHPQPTPLLVIHGLADTRVPFAGGASSGVAGDNLRSIPDSVAIFTHADGCNGAPATRESLPVTSHAWTSCTADRTVRLITIADAGHQWPGGIFHPNRGADPPSNAIDATLTIVAFFAACTSTR